MQNINQRPLFYLSLLVLLLTIPISAQKNQPESKKLALTIDNIMEGNALTGTAPSGLMWSYDGKRLYFNWKKPDAEKAALFMVTSKNPIPQQIEMEELLKFPPLVSSTGFSYRGRFGIGLNIKYNKNRNKALLVRNGDIFLMSLPSGKINRLTATDGTETGVGFTFWEDSVFFTRGDNLFLISLKHKFLQQKTSFTREPERPQQKPDEISRWLTAQQKELFQEFDPKSKRARQTTTYPQLDDQKKRKSFFLSEDQNVSSFSLSPCEKYVIFTLSEQRPETKGTIVPNYVTRSGYTEDINAHPKAAYLYRSQKTGVLEAATGKITWVDYGLEERPLTPFGTYWSPDGKTCVLSARSEDRKDIWMFELEIDSGKTSVLEHVHDDSWTGYLGLTNITWLPDSRSLLYISEKDGYAHIYRLLLPEKNIEQLTQGSFEVYSFQLSKNYKKLYFTSNEAHPGEKNFYSMPLKGGSRTRITQASGQHEAYLSPDETTLATLFSTTNHPSELFLQGNKPGAEPHQVTLSTTADFQSYSWHKPQVITYKARDGVEVYARLYKTQNWNTSKPAVIFIHGAGYLQNAHKGWSSYFREYMFHNFLLEQGYLVLDADYRGSAGYGRDCRTGIYRHMGGNDLEDVVDGAKYLIEEHGVDPGRIGTYGGSYGGFLTFMAMFTTPDVFTAGAALRPVTDWAHYHNSYTQDILNLPHKDSEAYKRSSPIYFANGLKGALLICHGMIDTNVHFQDTVRLVQRLIELRKENWECAIYPVEGHGFRNPTSWADEYKRIFRLFENNLK